MSKNTEFAEKLAELVVREAELRSGRTDGYIKPEIVREVWQEHIDELEVERESISAKFPDNPDLQRRLAEGPTRFSATRGPPWRPSLHRDGARHRAWRLIP